MSYHADWYVRYQVIDARVWGAMSVDDTELHAATCVQMLTEAQIHAPDNIVHLLFDALEADTIPPIYLMISKGVRVLKFRNRGTMFLVTRNSAIRSVIEVTAHLSRDHFPLRVFNERQAALNALASHLAKDALKRDVELFDGQADEVSKIR